MSHKLKGASQIIDTKEGASLGAAVMRDGTLGRVDGWTPFDELSKKEPLQPGEPGYDEDDDREITITVGELKDMLHKARLAGLNAFLRYVWFGATNLWEAMKRLLAITRKNRNDLIRGMSATQVAWMLQETKAATSAREIRVVETYLRSWGVLGYQGTGGSKSRSARDAYSKAQQGNDNRKRGQARKQAAALALAAAVDAERADDAARKAAMRQEAA